MQGVFNFIVNNLIVRDDAFKASVTALKEHINDLKGKLFICKVVSGNEMLVVTPKHKVNVLKSKEFTRTRFAKDMASFFLGIQQYFRAKGIVDDAIKVDTNVMYFTDLAILWWHRRSIDEKRGGTTIITWEEFQKEFKRQFY